MSSSSVSVTVRVRPLNPKETSQLQINNNEVSSFIGDGSFTGSSIQKNPPKGLRRIVQVLDERVLIFDPVDTNPMARFQKTLLPVGKRVKEIKYAFDRVFDENATQEMVYENTAKPLLDGVLEGYNATVFAYGATGCGKTHTISGSPEDPGIIFLTMKELFDKMTSLADEKIIEITMSYLEIYNESIRDLLVPSSIAKPLSLREDSDKKIAVPGLTSYRPQSVNEVMEIILKGNANRTISPTEANSVSSRSHAVLQINVAQKPRTADISEEHFGATLSIIDLAGSERASVTKNRGDRLLEGANINRSLLALGNCINALCDPHRRNHVPYRDSKLTRLLKFSLGGNCKTVMIVCVSPCSTHYDETYNTLKYGNRAKNIKTKVSRNMITVDRHVSQYVKAIYELRQEVSELKKKLEDKKSEENDRISKKYAFFDIKLNEGIHKLHTTFEKLSSLKEQYLLNMNLLLSLENQFEIINSWLIAFDIISNANLDDETISQFKFTKELAKNLLNNLENKRQITLQEISKTTINKDFETTCDEILKELREENLNETLINLFLKEAKIIKITSERDTLLKERANFQTIMEKTYSMMQQFAKSSFEGLNISVLMLKNKDKNLITQVSLEEKFKSSCKTLADIIHQFSSKTNTSFEGETDTNEFIKPSSPFLRACFKKPYLQISSPFQIKSPKTFKVHTPKKNVMFHKGKNVFKKKKVRWNDQPSDTEMNNTKDDLTESDSHVLSDLKINITPKTTPTYSLESQNRMLSEADNIIFSHINQDDQENSFIESDYETGNIIENINSPKLRSALKKTDKIIARVCKRNRLSSNITEISTKPILRGLKFDKENLKSSPTQESPRSRTFAVGNSIGGSIRVSNPAAVFKETKDSSSISRTEKSELNKPQINNKPWR
ncbi:hypothetical protein PNEG_02444 [Pneumocystis murina B123]|uniref:Kinesin-like protein n=1 Tax=Pneumocystis murina (strain B123) TaxID=1069680 RepID=M7P5E1_PNEMU|nr:hypothetical protein PNEG_02444 [Pneumocystis murina B123]EMR09100.1 hypothetical protein PNEG_02444 [Pneumocystis murina B123]